MVDDTKNDMKKYKLIKESKVGRMDKFSVIVGIASLATLLGIGHIVVTGIGDYFTKEQYNYDSSYDSYSEQIESMMNIDLDSSLEEKLNSLQMLREVIDHYQNSDSLITKANTLTMLANHKDVLETVSLEIAKRWCANEWGGNASDYKILPEGSTLPGWVVTNPQTGTHELPHGQLHDFLDDIGKLQGYSSEQIDKVDVSDNFVSLCDNVVRSSGMIATDLSSSKSK